MNLLIKALKKTDHEKSESARGLSGDQFQHPGEEYKGESEDKDKYLQIRKIDDLLNTDLSLSIAEDTHPHTVNGIKNNLLKIESDQHCNRLSALELFNDLGKGKYVPTPVTANTVFEFAGQNTDRKHQAGLLIFIGLWVTMLIVAGKIYYSYYTTKLSQEILLLENKRYETGFSLIDIPDPLVIKPDKKILSDEIGVGKNSGYSNNISVNDNHVVLNLPDIQVKEKWTQAESIQNNGKMPVQELDENIEIKKPAPDISIMEIERIGDSKRILPGTLPDKDENVLITRSEYINEIAVLINTAISYYMDGKYSKSEAIYRQILKTDNTNSDALLGMAAIAYSRGHIQEAYEYSMNILKAYPDDAAAQSALLYLNENTKPRKAEGVLRKLIQENPEHSYLYFMLGNIYAKQSRWGESHRKFFKAYRMQQKNPNYAYNLAVSLDHLGRYRIAGNYYRMALDLADTSQVSFDHSLVKKRLDALSLLQNTEYVK